MIQADTWYTAMTPLWTHLCVHSLICKIYLTLSTFYFVLLYFAHDFSVMPVTQDRFCSINATQDHEIKLDIGESSPPFAAEQSFLVLLSVTQVRFFRSLPTNRGCNSSQPVAIVEFLTFIKKMAMMGTSHCADLRKK